MATTVYDWKPMARTLSNALKLTPQEAWQIFVGSEISIDVFFERHPLGIVVFVDHELVDVEEAHDREAVTDLLTAYVRTSVEHR